MSDPAPFDTRLPSPLARLFQLRAGASEAVVRDGELSDVQTLMARPGLLEASLWDELGEKPLRLLVLTGSAGSGKSATMNHLLKRVQQTGEQRIGEHLADATHSDAPDRGQAERLADFFGPFRDGAPEPLEPCRAIAMNTGMALRFFTDLPSVPGAPALRALETVLRSRLGLPRLSEALDPPGWMWDAVLVVNLDQRTTAGMPGSLFETILQRLNPHDETGVLEGAPRCHTCQVSDWCWPMANAAVLSSEPGRQAVDAAAGDVALARGRQIAPRSLWDAAAELALGGLSARQLAGRDPCFAIADAAAAGNEGALVHAMACNGALGPVLLEGTALTPAADGSLLAEIASRDPSYDASLAGHKLIADAGLDPQADAALLTRALGGQYAHPAVRHAARALEAGAASSTGGDRLWGRVLARAAWLAGELRGGSDVDSGFTDALAAQSNGSTELDDSAEGQVLEQALNDIEWGLAASFGLTSGSEHYFPTSSPGPGAEADLMVRVNLVQDELLRTRPDPILVSNKDGAAIVRYRPLTLSLNVADKHVAVDYPLWRLLRNATRGAAPSMKELERALALRQAIRAVGVKAAADLHSPLLVRERGPVNRRFRIVVKSQASGLLRATEVR
ncbi:hypothetical protein [Actinoplanes rectilineatus]|uniref:hypothetical protein n=1 Tax=Actinoplanes rectilineatus TaxID=113571 RepID=UPI000B10C5CD|nr:hypothetical protein [Actinoplanes rectilineatus]